MITLRLFPKILGIFINKNSEKYKDKLTKKCYLYKSKSIDEKKEWVSKVYNSNSKKLNLSKCESYIKSEKIVFALFS